MKFNSKLVLGLAAVLILFCSCASNTIDASVLESDVFEVTQISYTAMSLYDAMEMKSYNIEDVYANLPFDAMKESFFNKYGYELSFDLYDENDYANFVEDSISWDNQDVKYFSNKKASDSNQTVWVVFSIDNIYGYLHWSFDITLPNGKTLGYRAESKKWSMDHEFVDKDAAAQLAYKTTNIMFERVNGINAYAYMDDNSTEDGFYVPADQEVTIMFTIIDSGNPFVAGGIWEHQVKTFTFEKGKKYKFSYEIDRGHFLQSDWTVDLIAEEVKN